MQQNEHELIARSLAEDHEAYAELVNRYKKAVYHHCFAIVRNEDVAEDIAQDTFITAYYKLSAYDPTYKFSTWLFKIATNKALNVLKKTAKEVPADDDVLTRIVSHTPSPERQGLHSELHLAVANLTPRYRAVVSMYYWQGLSYNEIAHVLMVPEGSVKGWMKRAKEQLRKELS
jgi:RNA polymerase sigma-70 factor (ECF subfamily)